MPKLLIINVTCNQGSTGKIAEQVGETMMERGWDVYLAHGSRRVNSTRLKSISFSSLFSEYMHALKSLLFDASGLGSKCPTRRLLRELKKINPDIVYLNNIHGYYINYKLLFKYLKETQIPVVWTLHDCWTFTGHCAYFDNPKCDKWIDGCKKCDNISKYPASLLIDRSRRNYEEKKKAFLGMRNLTLVPVSEWLGGLLGKSFLADYPISVIHNGIDLSIFHPYEKVSDGKFYILGVSNVWEPRKGLDDVYALRQILPSEYEIILVGLTKEQLSKLPKGITGIMRTNSQEELAMMYSKADVLINPTYEDNFPTVNLEALACGTPVITYNTGGSPEALNEKTGIVVDKGDIKAMAGAIVKMRDKPFSSSACRKHAEEFFNKDKCFLKYADLFEGLLTHVRII